ncbi:MAG: hypothetical protein WCH46_00310 [bacterium]
MKHTILLIFAFFILSEAKAQAQWSTLNGPADGEITFITRISPYVFCVASSGGLYRSDDDGVSWKLLDLQLSPSGKTNCMLADGINIFLCCAEGLYKSTNFGATWTKSDVGVLPADQSSLSILRGGSSLYLLTSSLINPIYASRDSGQNWHTASDYLPPNSAVTVISTQDSTVYASCDRYGIFLSRDYGKNWKVANGNRQSFTPAAMLFCNQAKLFASFSDRYSWFTTDHGNNWTEINTFGSIRNMCGSANILYGSIDFGVIWRSIDSGVTWVMTQAPLPFGNISNTLASWGTTVLSSVSRTEYVLQSKVMCRSTDSGNHWVVSNQGISNSFVTAVLRKDEFTYAGTVRSSIYSSSDEGASWLQADSVAPSNTNQPIHTFFSGSNCILASISPRVDTSSSVIRSVDKGRTWATVFYPYRTVYNFCTLGNKIFASSNDGVFESTDDGISWLRSAFKAIDINSVCVSSNNLIASDGKNLWVSIDLGRSWLEFSGVGTENLVSTGDQLYGMKNYGFIRFAEDLKSWKVIPLNQQIYSLYSDTNAVFALTQAGLFYLPKHNMIWRKITVNVKDSIFQSISSDYKHLYAGTSNYGVWKADYTLLNLSPDITGQVANVSANENNLIVSYDINTNSSTAKISLSEPSTINLDVYDILGRKVHKLINHGTFGVGVQRINVDPNSTLSAGEYFILGTIGDKQIRASFVVIR